MAESSISSAHPVLCSSALAPPVTRFASVALILLRKRLAARNLPAILLIKQLTSLSRERRGIVVYQQAKIDIT